MNLNITIYEDSHPSNVCGRTGILLIPSSVSKIVTFCLAFASRSPSVRKSVFEALQNLFEMNQAGWRVE